MKTLHIGRRFATISAILLLASCGKKADIPTTIDVTVASSGVYVAEPTGGAYRLNITTSITPSGTGANGVCSVTFDIYNGTTLVQASSVDNVPIPGTWKAPGAGGTSAYNIKNLKITSATSYAGTDGKTYTIKF